MDGNASCMLHSLDLWLYGIRKEGNVLFNDALNTFYLQSYVHYHFMGYSFQFAARNLLNAPSHRQDSTGRNEKYLNGFSMKDRSYSLWHQERFLKHRAKTCSLHKSVVVPTLHSMFNERGRMEGRKCFI